MDLYEKFYRKSKIFKAIFDKEDGQRLLIDLMSKFKFNGTPNVYNKDGGIDAMAIAVATGHREVISYILKFSGLTDMELAELQRKSKTYDL